MKAQTRELVGVAVNTRGRGQALQTIHSPERLSPVSRDVTRAARVGSS